jgi:hypothetical protein
MKSFIPKIAFLVFLCSLMHFNNEKRESQFRERGLNIAKNSFATGCAIQGRDDCFKQHLGNRIFEIQMRSECLEDLMVACNVKTEAFKNFFSGGK